MKTYYLQIQNIEYPLGFIRGYLRQQYQTVKTVILRSYTSNQPDDISDKNELIMIIDLRHHFDGPYRVNEIKYGRIGDEDWMILESESAISLYDQLGSILEKIPKNYPQNNL